MFINNDNIIKDDDPRIREKSEKVTFPLTKEDEELIEAMHTYVYNSTIDEIAERDNLKPAVGISAIQVGVKKRITCIILKDEDGNPEVDLTLINPRIVSHSKERAFLKTGEGCLSVPENHEGYINRYARVKIEAYDYDAKEDVTIKADDYLAIVLQHELDHFKGVLFYDHIRKDDPFFIDNEAIEIE